MTPLAANWLVVIAYFALTLWLGERVGRGQTTVDDYFLAGRRMPWWSTCLSIVGTETSTLTFVGVPAIAYGGDLTFLQVAMGYVVGRVLVAWLLVPAYFAGSFETAYELLGRRFGSISQRAASMIFLVSRCLADGVRLFATALVLQALLPMPLWLAVVGVSSITLVYTLRGGLRAVIWNDAVQLAVYLSGAALALVLLLRRIPGGWTAAHAALEPLAKLRVLDFAWSWSTPYMFWAGLIGGATLTMATHGTDQMFVQRLLACGSTRQARRAVMASGVLVLAQLTLFLVLGSLLFVFYELHPPASPFASGDQVFPRFIAEQMPIGVGGLVIAAVFAAAMSTLSSSMSSVASAATLDFALRGQSQRVEASALRVSRWYTAAAAVMLTGVATLARAWGSVLEAGLTITSITFGAVLGIFLLARSSWRIRDRYVAIALFAGVLAALVAHQTALAWTWLAPLGATVTFAVGAALAQRAPAGEA